MYNTTKYTKIFMMGIPEKEKRKWWKTILENNFQIFSNLMKNIGLFLNTETIWRFAVLNNTMKINHVQIFLCTYLTLFLQWIPRKTISESSGVTAVITHFCDAGCDLGIRAHPTQQGVSIQLSLPQPTPGVLIYFLWSNCGGRPHSVLLHPCCEPPGQE